MGNYSSLIATINANIKANNNHEITGAITNSVLNAMVNSLGAGYQYMGMATPTIPGSAQTPDYKCFYLAITPGTYTNLGGLVVADGEVALLKWDTTWTKVATDIASVQSVIKDSPILAGEYVDGYYIDRSTHEPISAAGFGYIRYVVNGKIRKLRISGKGVDSSADTLVFYKDVSPTNGNYIGSYKYTGNADEEINVPVGTQLICLSAWYRGGEIFKLSEVEFWDDPDFGCLFKNELIRGSYINTNGNYVSSGSGAIRKILIPECSSLRIKGTAIGGYTLSIAFYSSYETHDTTTFIKGYTFSGAVDQTIDVPKHAKCVALGEWAKGERLTISDVVCSPRTTDLRNILTNELVAGYYLNNSYGLPTASTKGSYRKFYNPGIANVRIKGTAIGGSTLSIAFYTDYSNIGGATYIRGFTFEGDVDTIVNVPENAKCIAIGEWLTESLTLMDAGYEKKQVKLYSCLDKPFNFGNNTKKAVFFGDSITYGATSGSGGLHNTEGYPILLCGKLGLIYTPRTDANPSNQAVSGSLFTTNPNVSEQTIASRIMATSFPADVFFIAGGCNDYNCNALIGDLDSVAANELCGALNNICSYLQTNYPNAEVFFITPINQTRGKTQPTYGSGDYTQNEYRDAIFKVATKWGYNVIDGSQIGFPEENGDYKDLMLYDGIHPTELGYELYAKTLAGLIL